MQKNFKKNKNDWVNRGNSVQTWFSFATSYCSYFLKDESNFKIILKKKLACRRMRQTVLDSNNFSIGIHSFKVLVQIHYSQSRAPPKTLLFLIFQKVFGRLLFSFFDKIGPNLLQMNKKNGRKKAEKNTLFVSKFPINQCTSRAKNVLKLPIHFEQK